MLSVALLLAGMFLLGVPIVDLTSLVIALAALVLMVSLFPPDWRFRRHLGHAATDQSKATPKAAAPANPTTIEAPIGDGHDHQRE